MQRKELERAIIGACILEEKYGTVQHLLKPVNFTDPELGKIWAAIERLYPHQPTDMLSVNIKYKQMHKSSAALLIAECTAKVYSSTSLVHWCILLLEEDMLTKFEGIITKASVTHSRDIEKSGHLKEVLNYIHAPEPDVFKLLPAVYKYLSNYGLADVANSLDLLNDQILARIDWIKKSNHLDRLKLLTAKAEINLQDTEAQMEALIKKVHQSNLAA
jgi:hypothetical protein